MDLHLDDAGFVRAPRPLVYRRITHVANWPFWWPGARVSAAPSVGGDEVWNLEFRGAVGRRLRLAARTHTWRHEHGFSLALAGDVDGAAEFWLEAVGGGTVVHHLVVGRTDVPHPLRVLADYRRALRRGLWGFKDALHVEMRTSAGLVP